MGAVFTSYNDFYRLPVLHYPDWENWTLGSSETIHTVPIGPWQLSMAVRPRESDLLIIAFHGAFEQSKFSLPRFERFGSSRDWPGTIVNIADPGMIMCDMLTSGWYRGTDDFDLELALLPVIERLRQGAGARRLIFAGGSAGGFAALRFSWYFPDSLAFVYNPQTDLVVYGDLNTGTMMKHCFPKGDIHHSRFSCLKHYESGSSNRVYYIVNQTDDHHCRHHMAPFAALFGLGPEGGMTADGRVRILLEDFGSEGHAPLPVEQFHAHLIQAVEQMGS